MKNYNKRYFRIKFLLIVSGLELDPSWNKLLATAMITRLYLLLLQVDIIVNLFPMQIHELPINVLNAIYLEIVMNNIIPVPISIDNRLKKDIFIDLNFLLVDRLKVIMRYYVQISLMVYRHANVYNTCVTQIDDLWSTWQPYV